MAASDNGLRSVRLLDAPPASGVQGTHPILTECARQLYEYFEEGRRKFDLPLDAAGTPWQKSVWAALCEIPYGSTATYGRIAAKLGAPNASRAVGAANGRNPIWIIVPCHRVVGADGMLTGYAGGLTRKQWLLDLERSSLSLFDNSKTTHPKSDFR